MVWWSISLPFQGVSLLFSRTFFSLQRPWATTALAGAQPGRERRVAAALYGPFGIAGIVLGTVVGTVTMCVAQGLMLRRELGGIEGRRLVSTGPDAGGGGPARRRGLRHLVRPRRGARPLVRRPGRVGAHAIGAGIAVYAGAVWVLRVPEARQIRRLLLRRGP